MAKLEEPSVMEDVFARTIPVPSLLDNSIVISSTETSISSLFAIIPSPPITLIVASPVVAPPVKPEPAITEVIVPLEPLKLMGVSSSNILR